MKKNNSSDFEIGDEAVVAVDSWSGGKELGRIVLIVDIGIRMSTPWINARWENSVFGFHPKDLRKVTKLDKVLK